MKFLLLGGASLVFAAGLGVFGVAKWRLSRTYDVALPALAVQPEPGVAEEGARLARVFGCRGCHRAAGNVLFDQPNVGRLIAPNLTRVAADYSDAQLARLIRSGVKRDGTSVVAMPTEALTHMADDDLAAVISWLRAVPTADDATNGATVWRPLGLLGLALHKVPLGADAPHDPAPPALRARASRIEEGAYLVSVTCRACHALHEVNDNGFGMATPPLVDMAQAYSPEEFQTLLTTGIATGGREVGLMSEIARGDTAAMTGAERQSILAYLQSPEAAVAP
ncbi:MAG: cytochrome c [Cypionkella sp.]